MSKKPYSPMASYSDLKDVEKQLKLASTAEDVRKLVISHGAKVGYKAFCYMLSGRQTAAQMKPDEACVAAHGLEEGGDKEAALAIYKEVIAAHPDHSMAKARIATVS
jgi:hypothetical protein